MRLTLTLTLGILFGVGLTLLVNVTLRVRREADLLENDIRKDHVILGRALSIDLAEEWRSEGRAAAFALAERMNAERASIDIRAVDLVDVDEEARPHIERSEVFQHLNRRTDDERLVTWLPLSRRAGPVGALRLEESLAPARAYVRSTVLRTVASALMGLTASTVLAFVFGFILVGRPVRALVAKARRVGEGDLGNPLDEGRKDELGTLARELNAMCARLAVARDDLERLTEQRLATVQQLRHADRLSTVGLLSAGIAHELGTPLNIVAGRGRLIADAPEATPLISKNALVIVEQAERMTKIVRQLLDFARARRPAKATVDVARLARETAEMLSTLAAKRAVTLAVESDGSPVLVSVDAGQLQQAITNLVVNAMQASDAGKRVVIRVQPGDASSRQHVCVSVLDEGVGMDDAQLQSVFTPFYTTKDVGEGTGLGLAVAWGLVQENGGHISVHSEKARGSTFTIHLPRES